MATEISRRLFTVDDYHRMADAGILSQRDRVELIYGEVLAMSPSGPRHGAWVDRAAQVMFNITRARAIVRVQGNVGLDEYDEPQPDIVLLRPKDDFYFSKLPSPSDILLIIEVADSSLEYDRTIKARLYAETGIQEYWVMDLRNDRLFAYSNPSGKSYGIVRELHRGDVIAPQLLSECRIEIAALLL